MKIGDKVRISKDSEFYRFHDKFNPVNIDGVLDEIISDNHDYNYKVKWNNGKCNGYRLEDLELIEERPERYASREVNGMDVLDLINHWNLNFSEGNILKYLLRDKGEDINDFKKIVDYANREVKRLEGCK